MLELLESLDPSIKSIWYLRIIDTFVDIEKGKLVFTTRKVRGCFACCLPET